MAGGKQRTDRRAGSTAAVTRRDALKLGVGALSGGALFADVSTLWSSGSAQSSEATGEQGTTVSMRLYRTEDAGGDGVTPGDTVVIDFTGTTLPWETYTSRIRLVHERTQTVKASERNDETDRQVLRASLDHPGTWRVIYLVESSEDSLEHEETITVESRD